MHNDTRTIFGCLLIAFLYCPLMTSSASDDIVSERNTIDHDPFIGNGAVVFVGNAEGVVVWHAIPAQQRIDIQFERVVFAQDGNAERARARMSADLDKCIHQLDRICKLTTVQESKLELSGIADRVHFFEQVDEQRKRQGSPALAQLLNSLETRQLRQKAMNGLYDSDSFFVKSLSVILTEEQLAKLEQSRQSRIHEAIELAFTDLELVTKLSPAQREGLTKFLTGVAPIRIEFRNSDLLEAHSDRFAMLYLLWLHAETDVKPFFAPDEWTLLKPRLQQYQSFKEQLSRKGLIPVVNAQAAVRPATVKNKEIP